MLVVAIGLVVGLAAAAAGAQSLAGFLYGVPTSDLLTFTSTAVVLTAVSLLACVVPARRAMRVSPLEAIRHE